MQDWKFLSKNFDDISDELIANKDLLRLNIHISMPGYLKERRPCFIKITEDNNKKPDQNAKKEPIVSD